MGIGGRYQGKSQSGEFTLIQAYTGRTHFKKSGVNRCGGPHWVIDYLNSGRQRQRIEHGTSFIRPTGIAAIYRPNITYEEYRQQGTFLDESYITFQLHGGIEETFYRLTDSQGWIHVRDPESILEDRLRRIGQVLFYRGPGHSKIALGLSLELVGVLESSVSISPRLRQVRNIKRSANEDDMASLVERYIREHIDRPIMVSDLAKAAGMGESSFAHKYPPACGETPYQTIMRLKLETVKRLLIWENTSVKDAARRTGFSSPYHLSRTFKSYEGIPPGSWVKKIREKGEKMVSI